MSGDRCERCDRVDCPTAPYRRMDCDEFDATAGLPGDEKYETYLALDQGCRDLAVDWRSRCLAAERDRNEAVARAERAEAECGAMRAVVEAAFDMFDTGVSVSFSGDDQARAVRSFEAAVDEWRRTRQSKEQAS